MKTEISQSQEGKKLIYRYFPNKNNDHRDNAITQAVLWFSNPDDFNDPLDSNLAYRQTYSREEIKSFWQNFLDNNPECPKSLAQILESWGKSNKFVDYQNKKFKEYRESIGVACFSATPTNILMWSHYADNHKGVVYGFSADLFSNTDSDGLYSKPLEVKYPEERKYELLSYALLGKEMQFAKELTTKAMDWSYEQEYRFIGFNCSNLNKSFRRESLKSIIFGSKTPSDEIERIKSLCGQHGFGHVAFKQANIATGSFEINIVNI